MHLLAEERQELIAREVKTQGVVRIEDLVNRFSVSAETIRRDLEKLEVRGQLRRVYGGAVLVGAARGEPVYPLRSSLRNEHKRAIGREAARLVEPGETMVVDLGTTTLEFARGLAGHRDLVIITNCLHVALVTAEVPGTQVIVTGGALRSPELALSGADTINHLRQYRVNKAILGAGGLDLECGVTDYHREEAAVRRVMAEIAAEVIVLADHSKFGVQALTRIIPADSIDLLITDWETPEYYLSQLRERGVRIIIAGGDK